MPVYVVIEMLVTNIILNHRSFTCIALHLKLFLIEDLENGDKTDN